MVMLALSLSLGASCAANAQQDADAGVRGESSDAGVNDDAAADGGVPHVDLSTPRSAVRSFVFSMQRAADDRPELIDEAVHCLDVDWLAAEEDFESRARQLAAELFDVLANLDIPIEDVPDSSKKDSLTLWESTSAGPAAERLSVVLRREKKQWKFSRETLEQLGAISTAIKGERVEEKDDDLRVHKDLKSPRATMKTFLEAMDADPPDVDRAADCLAPPEDPGPAWAVLRHDHAYRLYSVLLRVRAPVLSDIPEHPSGARYTWFVHKGGRVVLRRTEEDNPETGAWRGEWRFSRSTLASLPDLYEEHAYGPILPEVAELGYAEHLSLGLRIERAMPAALRADAFGLAIWQWLGVLCLTILGVVLFGLGAFGARLLYVPVARARKLEVDSESIERMSRALGWLLLLYALYRVVAANTLLLPAGLLTFLYPFSRAMVLVAVALVGLRVVQIAEKQTEDSNRHASRQVASLVLPLLESFFRLAIGAIFIAFVLRLLGFSQTAVLGGLGLLGAAVGLAAHSSIANVIAAISIVYDRPFRVGDWVNLDGVDATVERLGLVSVRLRTFYNSVVVVPNSHIVTQPVDNYGERRYRRLRCFLRLRYDTPAAKIEALCEGLRELVRLHQYTRKDYYHIYLNELTPSSADVMIYIFFDVPDWATELRERHRFLIDAIALVEDLGIQLAYPTQRLLVERVGDTDVAEGDAIALRGPPDREGIGRAKRLFMGTYGDPPKARGPVVIEQSPLTAGFENDSEDEG